MDDDLYESCLEEVLAVLKNKGFSFILKREQDSALRHLFKRKDVLAVLPTGFGKSLIFQLLVFLAKAKGRREGGEGFAAILVITPLSSIIQDQISEISSMGLSGCNLSKKLECLDDIHNGKVDIVYASAEAATDKRFVESLKKKNSFNKNLAACIVDETHTVETWTGLR